MAATSTREPDGGRRRVKNPPACTQVSGSTSNVLTTDPTTAAGRVMCELGEQQRQPLRRRPFVVVDEDEQPGACLGEGPVTCRRDAGLRLVHVADGHACRPREGLDLASCTGPWIVVDHEDADLVRLALG